MSSVKLTAAVGDPHVEGKSVPNRPADVKIVHEMLLANGYSLPATDKINAAMIKCIKAVQKKAGMKEPDGIVEPGKTTFNAMMPKYRKLVADLGSGERVLLKDGSKDILISKADYEKIKANVLKELDVYVKHMEIQWATCEKIRKGWQDSVSGAKGYLNKISSILVMSAGHVTGAATLPDMSKWGKAKAAIAAARSAVKSGDLKKAKAAFGPAEKASNELYKECYRYASEMGGTAKTMGDGLKLTTTIGWGVVGVMATPVLVGAGIPASAATILGTAGTAYLSTYVDEVGKYASGQSDGFVAAIVNINVSVLLAVGTLGISKLQPQFLKSVASGFAGPLSRATLGKISTGAAEKYILSYLTTAGQSALSTAVSEVVGKVRKRMEKGEKFDYEKELKDSLEKVIRSAVLAPVFEAVSRFTTAFAVRNRDKYVTGVIVENPTVKKMMKDNQLDSKQLAKLKAGVANKIGTKIGDKIIPKVIDTSTGKESAAELEKKAAALLAKDRDVQKIVDQAIQAELKKLKVGAN